MSAYQRGNGSAGPRGYDSRSLYSLNVPHAPQAGISPRRLWGRSGRRAATEAAPCCDATVARLQHAIGSGKIGGRERPVGLAAALRVADAVIDGTAVNAEEAMRLRAKVVAGMGVALLGGLGLAPAVQAQGTALDPVLATQETAVTGAAGMAFFAVGWQRLDLGDVNPHLQAAGYPAFSEDFVSLGGSTHALRRRVMIGGEGHALVGPSETSLDGQFRTRLAGGYGMFNLGYALVTGPRTALFPTVGFGAGGVVLDILDRGAPSFGEVLQNPRRSARLTSGGLLLDGSVGLSYRLTERPRRPGRGPGGLAVGLRAGYTFTPFTTEWRTDAGNDVAGGPEVSLQGVYLRAMVGGWGAVRRPR
jgi:hypothetical protein